MAKLDFDTDDDIDWFYLLSLVWLYKWLLFVLALSLATAFFVWHKKNPHYITSGTLLVQDSDNNLMAAFAEQMTGLRGVGQEDSKAIKYTLHLVSFEFYKSLARRLLDSGELQEKFPEDFGNLKKISERSYRRFSLVKKPEPESHPSVDWMAQALTTWIEIDRNKFDRINLSVKTGNPELTHYVANTALDHAVSEISAVESRETLGIKNMIAKQVELTEKRLEGVEKEIADVIMNSDIEHVLGNEAYYKRIIDLKTAIENSNIKLRETKELYNQLARASRNNRGLSTNSLLENVRKEEKLLQLRIDAIKSFLDKAMESKEVAFEQQQKITQLKRRLEMDVRVYANLQTQLLRADIHSVSTQNRISVLNYSLPQKVRAVRRGYIVAAGGGIVGIGIWAFLVLILETLFPRINSADDLKQLNIKFLGSMPTFNRRNAPLLFTGEKERKVDTFSTLDSFAGRTFDRIRIALMNQLKVISRHEIQVVSITSGSANAGKTFITEHLTRLVSKSSRKTLVIDLDLFHAELTSRLNLQDKPGISDYKMNNAKLDEVIFPLTDSLHILPTGSGMATDHNMTLGKDLETIINSCKNRYDLIFIDTPPILEVSDAHAAVEISDLTIVVCVYRKTFRRQILNLVQQLPASAQGRLTGIINFSNGEIYKGLYGKQYGYYHKRKPVEGSSSLKSEHQKVG